MKNTLRDEWATNDRRRLEHQRLHDKAAMAGAEAARSGFSIAFCPHWAAVDADLRRSWELGWHAAGFRP